jgi:multidrug efflux pump
MLRVPEADQTFQVTFPDNGFAGLVLKPWGERKRTVFSIVPQVQARLSTIPGIRAMVATPPALPGGGTFPVEVVIGSTAEPDVILKLAEQIQRKAATNGMFAFPPTIDTKIDQPEVELLLDRDKVAALDAGHEGIMELGIRQDFSLSNFPFSWHDDSLPLPK